MTGVNERWEKFDALGVEQVQKDLADGIHGEDNKRAARACFQNQAQLPTQQAYPLPAKPRKTPHEPPTQRNGRRGQWKAQTGKQRLQS